MGSLFWVLAAVEQQLLGQNSFLYHQYIIYVLEYCFVSLTYELFEIFRSEWVSHLNLKG